MGEFTGTSCTNPNETDPVDTNIDCTVALDPADGNAALRIRVRVLDIGGEATDPNGCIETTNTVTSVEPSGGDQAQLTICPAESRPTLAPTPAPSQQLLSDTATAPSSTVLVLFTLAVFTAAMSAAVVVRIRRG